MPPPVYDPPRSCSFCGKAPDEAQKIVAGPAAGICDGCISLAIDVCFKAGVKVEGSSALADRERILKIVRSHITRLQDESEFERAQSHMAQIIAGEIEALADTPPQSEGGEG
jgi:hypothetical protein